MSHDGSARTTVARVQEPVSASMARQTESRFKSRQQQENRQEQRTEARQIESESENDENGGQDRALELQREKARASRQACIGKQLMQNMQSCETDLIVDPEKLHPDFTDAGIVLTMLQPQSAADKDQIPAALDQYAQALIPEHSCVFLTEHITSKPSVLLDYGLKIAHGSLTTSIFQQLPGDEAQMNPQWVKNREGNPFKIPDLKNPLHFNPLQNEPIMDPELMRLKQHHRVLYNELVVLRSNVSVMYDALYDMFVLMHQAFLPHTTVRAVAVQARLMLRGIINSFERINDICLFSSKNMHIQHVVRQAQELPEFIGEAAKRLTNAVKIASEALRKDAKQKAQAESDLLKRRSNWWDATLAANVVAKQQRQPQGRWQEQPRKCLEGQLKQDH